MLLIYTTESTTRLQYICKFIFEEVLGTSYSLTTDQQNFIAYNGSKINYSYSTYTNVFQIKPHTLLFETVIQEQKIEVKFTEEKYGFFESDNATYSFDVFAAIFYLISRYEEYLPHTKDMYGRYAHENSIAFKQNFLPLPLVNTWLEDFKQVLLQHFTTLLFIPKTFSFTPTYDIDIAWSYKEKGLVRNIGGFLQNPSMERITTLLGSKTDPFDCYDFLYELHKKNQLFPIYFFLVTSKNGIYDKNILPTNEAMQQLIQTHASKYKIGLHPSWSSYNDNKILKEEKNTLEKISGKTIQSSRQHYIKLNLPETYNNLINAGIKEDYSMGYGSINGFRASVASSFFWYDLSKEKITSLRIHPFCFMDANCFYEQKLTPEESLVELMEYYNRCKNINGSLITIFHNNFLGTDKQFNEWRSLYLKFISQLQQ